jgi:hypothetical protein
MITTNFCTAEWNILYIATNPPVALLYSNLPGVHKYYGKPCIWKCAELHTHTYCALTHIHTAQTHCALTHIHTVHGHTNTLCTDTQT